MAPMTWKNDAPSAAAADLMDGAQTVYDRTSANCALRAGSLSPFDLSLQVLDASGRCITEREDVAEYLLTLFDLVWGWSSTKWASQLATLGVEGARKEEILKTKAEAFWEVSAQLAAERLFGRDARSSESVYLFGPTGIDRSGAVRPQSADVGIPDAAEFRITTFIDGSRDPLMSISRTIMFVARRGEYPIADAARVDYLIHVPCGHRVASTHGEVLDWRPSIGGKRTEQLVTIKASNPSRAPERYPDFGRLAVPLRHLLLQGEVEEPKTDKDAPSYDYADEETLQAAFGSLIDSMRTKEGAARVSEQLKPAVTEKNYYQYTEGGLGIDAYAGYICGESGVAKGWENAFDDISLVIGPLEVQNRRQSLRTSPFIWSRL